MDDLISRAALLNDLSYCAPELWGDEEYIKAKIMKQPAVDAAPVVHGWWQGVSPMVDSMECSVCRYCIPSEELETPFCPWCGAKMDGEEV